MTVSSVTRNVGIILRGGGDMFSNTFIKATLEELQNTLEETYNSIAYMQSVCQHTDTTVKHDGNTGNYCPDDDTYWTDYKCNVCGKKWTTYSE